MTDPLALRRSIVVAIVFGGVLAGVGGGLALTSGLVFIAGLGGAAIGLVLAADPRPHERRVALAMRLALAMVVGAALGTWLIARAEGGVLGPLDYLWTVFGLLPLFQGVVAVVAAAWGATAGPIRWRA